jgi:hypothetical protein
MTGLKIEIHLDFPLDQTVRVGVPVNTEKEESFPLLVITIVCIQNLEKEINM